jgi:hypothetical protein
VKRLIRQKQTKQFLTNDGGWTPDVSTAQDFANMEAVIRTEQKLNLTGVDLYLLIDDKPSAYDVLLPLGPVPKETEAVHVNGHPTVSRQPTRPAKRTSNRIDNSPISRPSARGRNSNSHSV